MKLNFKASLLGGLVGLLYAQGIRNFDFPSENKGSRSYPEQSSRQAMRAHRRQQGGPGIVLDTATGQYVPRA